MKSLLFFGKIAVGLFWVAVILNLFMPLPAPYAMVLTVAGLISLAAHLFQSIIFARHNKRAPTMRQDIAQIMLFGAVHLMAVKTRAQ